MAYQNKPVAQAQPKAAPPEIKFKYGLVTAALWRNTGKTKDGREYSFLTANLQRSYTDEKGEWKNTDNLRASDVHLAVLALTEADKYMHTKQEGNQEEAQ